MKMHSELPYRQSIAFDRHQLLEGFSYVKVMLCLCSLAVFLIGCNAAPSGSGDTTSKDTSSLTPVVSTTPTLAPTPTPPLPTITLQVVNCPSSLSIDWDKLVGTTPKVNKVQKVICGSLEGAGTLDALVNVRYYSSDLKLDYYVYDNLYGTPIKRFSQQGLLDGDAQISPTGTIMTAEIGPGDQLKGNPDVFKNYQWINGSFQQILFPGIYPDMTYYQAEMDQAQLNAELAAGDKHDAWKATFLGVADHLATTIFHWTSANIHASTVRFSNHDGVYIVAVTNLGTGGGGFTVTMFHLDYNLYNIFEVSQVNSIDGTVNLSSPASDVQVTNPIDVNGSDNATGSILGKVVVYSDVYIAVGSSGDIHSPVTSGYTNFSQSVPYQLNAPGVQEGAVTFYATNQNNSDLSNQVVMVKVFLSA